MTGGHVYNVSRNIYVTYNSPSNDDPLALVRIIGAMSSDSIIILDLKKNIIYMNDRFKTFERYNVTDCHDVCEIMSKKYEGVECASIKISEIFKSKMPMIFPLRNRIDGSLIRCTMLPVLTRYGEISGVAFAATQLVDGDVGTRIQCRKRICQKQQRM